MKRVLNIRGDTIVEVLIAITIVSTVLGGAYASSNRSLNATRGAQERGESLKLAETQLERLKASTTVNADIFTSSYYFCFDENIDAGSLSDPANPDDYPAMCQYAPQDGVIYYVSIQGPGHPSGPGPDTFKVTSRWDKVGGGGTTLGEEVTLIYRMHPTPSGSKLPPTKHIPTPKVGGGGGGGGCVPPTCLPGKKGSPGGGGNLGGAGSRGQTGGAGGSAGQTGGQAEGGSNLGSPGSTGRGGSGGGNPNGTNSGGAGGAGWDP